LDGGAKAKPPPHLGWDSAVDLSSPSGMKEANHFDASGASTRPAFGAGNTRSISEGFLTRHP
jgi:hypothetical protein